MPKKRARSWIERQLLRRVVTSLFISAVVTGCASMPDGAIAGPPTTPAQYCAQSANPEPEMEIAACTRLIEAGDEIAESYFRRANAENRLRRFDIAIEDYSRAITLRPGNASYFNARGNAWNNRGDHVHAVRDYDQTLRLDPHAAETLDNRCWAKAAWLGEPRAALTDCEAALRLRPGHGNTLENLGFVYLRLGRFSDAIGAYTSALAENPSRPDSLFGRAIARQHIGQPVEADVDLAAARALNGHVDSEYLAYGITPAS